LEGGVHGWEILAEETARKEKELTRSAQGMDTDSPEQKSNRFVKGVFTLPRRGAALLRPYERF
jgi:hypothetical protein